MRALLDVNVLIAMLDSDHASLARYGHELVQEPRRTRLGIVTHHAEWLHSHHVQPKLSEPTACAGRYESLG